MKRGVLTFACGAAILAGATAAASGLRLGSRADEAALVGATAVPPASGRSQSVRVPLSQEESRQLAGGAFHKRVKSLILISEPMTHGDFRWDEAGVPDGPLWVRIDLSRQLISVFRSGHEIGTAVILYGAEEKVTPPGAFRVQWKRKDHHSRTYDAPMPFTLRLTDDGVSIHGSDVRRGRATHGCIGVPLDFARRLFLAAERGDEVLIVA